MDELAEIRAREQAATPGPWTHEGPRGSHFIRPAPDAPAVAQAAGTSAITQANGEFIAHARADIPTLLVLVDTRTAERDRYREAIYTYFRAHDEAASRAEQRAARHALWAVLDTEE